MEKFALGRLMKEIREHLDEGFFDNYLCNEEKAPDINELQKFSTAWPDIHQPRHC